MNLELWLGVFCWPFFFFPQVTFAVTNPACSAASYLQTLPKEGRKKDGENRWEWERAVYLCRQAPLSVWQELEARRNFILSQIKDTAAVIQGCNGSMKDALLNMVPGQTA